MTHLEDRVINFFNIIKKAQQDSGENEPEKYVEVGGEMIPKVQNPTKSQYTGWEWPEESVGLREQRNEGIQKHKRFTDAVASARLVLDSKKEQVPSHLKPYYNAMLKAFSNATFATSAEDEQKAVEVFNEAYDTVVAYLPRTDPKLYGDLSKWLNIANNFMANNPETTVYQGKFEELAKEPGDISVISNEEKYALQDLLREYFDVNQVAGDTLFSKFEQGRTIEKKSYPLNPKKESTKLKNGQLYLVVTTAQISGQDPEITNLSIKGAIDTTPNSDKQNAVDLTSMPFSDAVNTIFEAMPEHESFRIDEKASQKTVLPKKNKLLPEVKVTNSGSKTVIAALLFPSRSFPVKHPRMGNVRSSFDEKLVGVRVSEKPKENKKANDLFLDSLKLISATGYKPVHRQRTNPESGAPNPTVSPEISREFYESGRKLPTRNSPTTQYPINPKDLKNPEILEKKPKAFDVYIMTKFSPKGEPTNELYIGTTYGTDPQDALDQLVRFSNVSKTGYTGMLEKIFKVAHGLEKAPMHPKEISESDKKYVKEQEIPGSGSRKEKEEKLNEFLNPLETPQETKPKVRPRVREVSKEEIKGWK